MAGSPDNWERKFQTRTRENLVVGAVRVRTPSSDGHCLSAVQSPIVSRNGTAVGTGKKTPGGAGTHTGHTGHTDEPHNHPLKPKPNDTNPDAACPPYAPRTQRIGCAPALRSATLGCSFPRSPLPATSGRSPVRLSSIRETGVRAVLPHRPLRSRCSRSARAVGLSRRPIEADTGHTTPLPGSCVLSFPFPHTCQMPTSCTHRMGFGLRASAGHRRAGPMSARTARLRRVPAYSLRSGQNAHPPRAIPATTRGT